MKAAIIILGLLAIAYCKEETKKEEDEPKEKREAPVGHYASSGVPHSSHAVQLPAHSHGGPNSISVGAGYSIGAGKHGRYTQSSPAFSHGSHGGVPSLGGHGDGLSLSSLSGHSNLGAGGHGSGSNGYSSGAPSSGYKLSPQQVKPQFTLPGGQSFPSLEELMESLRSSGLNVGEPTHAGASPAALYTAPHGAAASGGHQQISIPQSAYGSPKFSAINLNLGGLSDQHSAGQSYSSGQPGLGAYSSSSMVATGPQLFNPESSNAHSDSSSSFTSSVAIPSSFASYAPSLSYGAPSSGHFGDGHSFGGLLGGAGHSFASGGLSLGSGGHSFGGPGHSLAGLTLGSAGHSFGGSGQSFGGHFGGLSSTGVNGLYGAPASSPPFKPSAFLGATADSQGDSFSGHSGFSGAVSGLSGKYSSPSYLPPSQSFGSSFNGHLGHGNSHAFSSPPRTTYGIPSGSYGLPGPHGSYSSNHFKYTPARYPGGFGVTSSSVNRAPHGHLLSLSPLGSHYQSASPSYTSPDSSGEHSYTSYNTIKYSRDLTPKKM